MNNFKTSVMAQLDKLNSRYQQLERDFTQQAKLVHPSPRTPSRDLHEYNSLRQRL